LSLIRSKVFEEKGRRIIDPVGSDGAGVPEACIARRMSLSADKTPRLATASNIVTSSNTGLIDNFFHIGISTDVSLLTVWEFQVSSLLESIP
jgi:hypothetical protein